MLSYPTVVTFLLLFSGFAFADSDIIAPECIQGGDEWDWVRSRDLFVQTSFERLIV